MNEGNHSVVLTILVRGGTNICNKTEWTLYQNISAQCEHLHEIHTWSLLYTVK